MNSTNKRGFTLIELMVVVGMILVLVGALTTSTTAARKRARVQKATADVKIISQAILAYENWGKNGKFELPTYASPVEANASTLAFLLGKEAAESGGKIPVMLMAQLRSGGAMIDPWGHPYKVRIKEGNVSAGQGVDLKSGFCLPNYYRLGTGERQ